MVRIHGVIALLLVLLAGPVLAAQGIKGRASFEGVLVEGVEIRLYSMRQGGFGPLTGDAPAKVIKTAIDGKYSVELEPGRYVVEAIKKKAGNTGKGPAEGDIYCLYSGSPVVVSQGKWSTVGLYMTTVFPEKRAKAEASRLVGRLTFKGEPVERSYLYAYATVDGYFHGPAEVLQPVAKGTFKVNLPPGTYYLVGRKRMAGGAYGPIDIGDKLNFYSGNPLVIKENEEVTVEIPLAERLSSLEEDDTTNLGLKVRVLDAMGKPLAGYFVLAYSSSMRNGPPAATSTRTDAKGETYIKLSPDAKFLRARASVGGPLEETEYYVDGDAPEQKPGDDAPLILKGKSR